MKAEEKFLKFILQEKRKSLGIEFDLSSNMCRRVNVETVARINRLTKFQAYALIDYNFRNFLDPNKVGEHLVGILIVDDFNFLWFDRTFDQIANSGSDILIIHGSSMEDTISKLNQTLDGNFVYYNG